MLHIDGGRENEFHVGITHLEARQANRPGRDAVAQGEEESSAR